MKSVPSYAEYISFRVRGDSKTTPKLICHLLFVTDFSVTWHRETCEYERKFEKSIRSVPSALQKSETNVSKKSERDAEISGNEHRWSNDPSCHRVGCSCSLLHDQHWRSSDGDFSRDMAVSTFELVGRVDIDFSGKQGCNAVSNKCGVEIRASENHKDLVQSVSNRRQVYQKTINSDTTENQFSELSYLSLEHEWEIGKKSRAPLAVWKLCRNNHMVPSSITETRATNRNLCNNDIYTRSKTPLQELRNEREPQHTQDLPSLLKLLNNEYPYRNETNKNVLTDREIRLFAKMYGITDFRLMFITYNNSVFWLEDPKGVYFWSRIDDSMIRGGDNLTEALTNYLFHDENLCYVDEYTCKLVPINAYDKEAEEWVKSPEKYFAKIDVTEILQKHKSEMDEKKNQQKKH
ncbi:hypothetical protein GLOIN_2v1470712 [Rhizophagus irregularis DAOM 181602=DAOM 197198]|uniref:Uncharacterized protein n=1 Tax=Rhizophagus irregularis (strain DAOM 181602 / DAOM 197198 / MUCL 43194) TaxID=747089 RepID=A0A2P4QVC2_RHIID|nr:hypothetical protein GLOIN_2v1470712 [Rhizophagus irregularis DAOM 181602=DAOM 197198]POG81610.1 hypothetical protein GLOIN_2v1470712 [Rhizophagus irregularis DAOM 181602=DAOM 197198]|eukprot:XP_025188476.1 hypothetical protein GLOIN_2v1470712 [Rhizophagus irregularis DAOM 181602=DAOM 197198]